VSLSLYVPYINDLPSFPSFDSIYRTGKAVINNSLGYGEKEFDGQGYEYVFFDVMEGSLLLSTTAKNMCFNANFRGGRKFLGIVDVGALSDVDGHACRN
jgi:hypothetical protein